jgi:hypothetical protein
MAEKVASEKVVAQRVNQTKFLEFHKLASTMAELIAWNSE